MRRQLATTNQKEEEENPPSSREPSFLELIQTITKQDVITALDMDGY